MGKQTEFARVIKPPGEKISSGRVFRPAKALRNKGWLKMLLVAFVLWFFLVGGWVGIGWLTAYSDANLVSFWTSLAVWWMPVNIGVTVFNLVWLIPGCILLPLYVRSIEYSVISETGKTLPEIYVKKGIVSVTRKHVPFRTITNISTTAGPLDRLFGIGSVEIETAGYSGQRTGPEEKLTGIPFYEEVRDFILQELRKHRGQYALTTEVVRREEEPLPKLAGRFDDDILRTLREIRELLTDIARKLEKTQRR
jgi:membrane protein YdbS with pleckstrin-like domain